jgi:pyruvate, orthophosphate dikinase
MVRLGLHVPPAFVLSTRLCAPINRGEVQAERTFAHCLREGIEYLEHTTGRRFGDPRNPLLVSVRSGAARSMPGMLETVLDVGLNAETVRGLIRVTGNPRLAWDSYRRFVQSFSEVVWGIPPDPFERQLTESKHAEQVEHDYELDPEALERLTIDCREIALEIGAQRILDDATEQLSAVARAVYRSWDSEKAKVYRRLNRLEDLVGTAVTVQTMVFGNGSGRSGAGVAFTRNPATGEKKLYADFLFDAQREDIVSGRRCPGDWNMMATKMPAVARELAAGAQRLEQEFSDVQDIEFTVENAQLYFLQTRAAKCTPRAALKIVVDLVREGLIDVAEGLRRVGDIEPAATARTRFAGSAKSMASATPASDGVASGRIAFDSERAKALSDQGNPVILVRSETSTEDVLGFGIATGILTAVGGRTAHAAVVARQLGKVCLVGCTALAIASKGSRATIGTQVLDEGDWLSLDGESGEIFLGKREIIRELPEAELATIQAWKLEAEALGSPKRAPTPS